MRLLAVCLVAWPVVACEPIKECSGGFSSWHDIKVNVSSKVFKRGDRYEYVYLLEYNSKSNEHALLQWKLFDDGSQLELAEYSARQAGKEVYDQAYVGFAARADPEGSHGFCEE